MDKSKNEMIMELLDVDDNSENLIRWADRFLGSLSTQRLKEIYDREMKENG